MPCREAQSSWLNQIGPQSARRLRFLHESSDPQPIYGPVATDMSRQFLSALDLTKGNVSCRSSSATTMWIRRSVCSRRKCSAKACFARRFYEKPSERSSREQAEAIRRARKLARKKAQREGLIAEPRGLTTL